MLVDCAATLEATPPHLEALYGALDRFWRDLDAALLAPPAMAWRLKFATATAEIGGNIIRHAYPPAAVARPLGLRLVAYAGHADACFTDRGDAFTAGLRGNGDVALDLAALPESGYGLPLVCRLVDELEYQRTADGVNHWRLTKRF